MKQGRVKGEVEAKKEIEVDKELAEWMKEMRMNSGKTQKQVALNIPLPRTYYVDIENEKKKHLKGFYDRLGCSCWG